jgi:hypothetical protein
MVYFVGKMRNCFNIEFVHYACLCMYVHTLRNKIMTAPPYSCDKLIMAIHKSHLLLEMCQNGGKSDELPL